MTRAEHIAWCKQRALEYVERDDLANAVASMLSDLRKHPETETHIGAQLGAGLMFVPGWIHNSAEVRKWIEGFN
jgi:hypothetical protein